MQVQRWGFGADAVDYRDGWSRQQVLHDAVVEGSSSDVTVLLEHPAVYTAGRRTQPEDMPFDGTPVVEVDRGGRITWHGPGQLVGYPIVRLSAPYDVVAHVRRIEAMIIELCAELGLATMQVEGRSGVWVAADARGPERKVAAIGIRVAKGVTLHGFAINCNNALDGFNGIVPCGIPDAGVTTLSNELARDVTVLEVADLVEARIAAGALTPVPRSTAPVISASDALAAPADSVATA
jgi:lipoyl(octanoyl) transferase